MIARQSCLAAASSLVLLAALVLLEKSKANPDAMGSPAMEARGYQPPSLLAEVDLWGTHKSLTFVSVTGNRMDVYEAEFGRGYVDLEIASLRPHGTEKFRSLHLHY